MRRRLSRARARGFSHVSTTLEAAMIMGWFALVVASEKRLDDAVTARRAVENAATASAHASAGSCVMHPVQAPVGAAQPASAVRIAQEERLGVPDLALPPVQLLGVAVPHAFPSQQTPLRHATATATTVNHDGAPLTATRQVSCEDLPPPSPIPRVAGLRTAIWARNVMGY
ncbi:MAG: hypothetical protein JST00_20620 [Deltaproteobacteria bacterium]|nr:hypothetical protein [Deltaproteobacteria bacterium]